MRKSPQLSFILLLSLSLFSCTNQIDKNERIEQEFNFSSVYFIEFGNDSESGLSLTNGHINFTGSKLSITYYDGANSDKESFNIRTVTFDDNPNKVLYRTNNGDFNVELQNGSINKVFLSGNGFSIIFNQAKPKVLINKPIPMSLEDVNESNRRLPLKDGSGHLIGSIDMTSNLEIKGGFYNYVNPKNASALILQPNGIDNEDISALNSYMRIMYETFIGEPGDFNNINELIQYHDNELNFIDNQFKNDFIEDFAKNNLRIIKWNTIEIVELNNMSALKISYTRQWRAEPYVNVEIYRIFNNDRFYSLTISYRESEKGKWEEAISTAKSSFRIDVLD